MRKIIGPLLLIYSGLVHADELSILYESDFSREEMELKLTSFGITVVYYLGSVHGGIIIVPCRETNRWVNVLSQVKGVLSVNPNRNVLDPESSSQNSGVLTCIPTTEATYDEESETLSIPQLYLDGKVYRVDLTPPFNIQDLQYIGELDIYQYE